MNLNEKLLKIKERCDRKLSEEPDWNAKYLTMTTRQKTLIEIAAVLLQACDDVNMCRAKEAPEEITNIADRLRWVAHEALSKANELGEKL